MILRRLSILNYKNIAETALELSPNINCFIGANGEEAWIRLPFVTTRK